jgi:hypothetical protein
MCFWLGSSRVMKDRFYVEHVFDEFPKYHIKIRIHKTIILSVILYGCETRSLTLREERRLRVFENRVLRRIFGLKRDELTGGWRFF